jgi:NAD(P)-dependent dehydrogenase (short-subunit alcohol dehydrogenase family)
MLEKVFIMIFENKIAVVTGGANGIGKCITEEFIKLGVKVAVIDTDTNGCDCDFYFCGDIAVEDTLIKFSNEVITKFGYVDFLVNNACISSKGILSDCGYEEFLYVQKVGVLAPYMLTKLLLPHFNEYAAIVNISSTRAIMSQADKESYTAAKGGISSLTHALAVSLAGRVRVNAISPGWIDTTNSTFSIEDNIQHPIGRVGKPIDIAKMVLFLCSNECGFITGENITIDGGMTKQMIYHNDLGWKYSKS